MYNRKNGLTTQKLVTLALLAAMSIILVYLVRLPIFAAAPFLEYDPADIPILIAAFAMGPAEGLILTVIVSVLQGFTVSASSGIIGIAMHIFAAGSFALTSGLIYRRNKTKRTAVIALAAGGAARTLVMIAWNLLVTPFFLGTPLSAVITLMPYIIAFNVIASVLNSVVTLVVYKGVEKVLFRDNAAPANV